MSFSQEQRSEMIGRHLGVSRAFSPLASQINDDIQDALADVENLYPEEQARFLSALMLQLSGKLSELHGNR